MVVLPRVAALGAMVTLRVVPLPPKVICSFGTSPVSEDSALSWRFSAGVSASPMVKNVALLVVFSTVERPGMLEIVGAVWAQRERGSSVRRRDRITFQRKFELEKEHPMEAEPPPGG